MVGKGLTGRHGHVLVRRLSVSMGRIIDLVRLGAPTPCWMCYLDSHVVEMGPANGRGGLEAVVPMGRDTLCSPLV